MSIRSRASKKTGSSVSHGGTGELQKRLLIVLIAIIVYRLGAYIPVPGIDPSKLASLFDSHSSGMLGMFNMFSGGALSRMTIFALGIMPYISASIVIQLFTAISEPLKALQKEGEAGRRKINQYTRYGTVLLAVVQSVGIARWLSISDVAYIQGFAFYFVSVITLVTGTVFLMWLGEQVTERGVGNGITLIIFASIVSRLPSALGQLFLSVKQGQMEVLTLLVLTAVVVAVIAFVVLMETAQRRIRIEYAKHQQGRKMYAAQTSHLPLKINMAGVIPVIFAQAIILVPSFLAKTFSSYKGLGWLNKVTVALSFGSALYMLLFAFAVVFFTFFYTALTYNPRETAQKLKESGAFLPSIRPGEQTARYIEKVMDRLTVVGAIYLTLVALLPQVLMKFWHVPIYFGGTSLLIVVVAVMDFTSQIQAHLRDRWYKDKGRKGLLRQ
jgi:preprotein translocase subunit SecY